MIEARFGVEVLVAGGHFCALYNLYHRHFGIIVFFLRCLGLIRAICDIRGLRVFVQVERVGLGRGRLCLTTRGHARGGHVPHGSPVQPMHVLIRIGRHGDAGFHHGNVAGRSARNRRQNASIRHDDRSGGGITKVNVPRGFTAVRVEKSGRIKELVNAY